MLSPDIVAALKGVSTATITTILLKKGIRRSWMHGPKPLTQGYERAVGRKEWAEAVSLNLAAGSGVNRKFPFSWVWMV